MVSKSDTRRKEGRQFYASDMRKIRLAMGEILVMAGSKGDISKLIISSDI
jgi:hypothetical protein